MTVVQEGDRYVARHLELDVSSFGDTLGEALENLIEALALAAEDAPFPGSTRSGVELGGERTDGGAHSP